VPNDRRYLDHQDVSIFRRTWWRAITTRASRWLGGASYLQKWIVLGVLIGMMAGLGAIVFYELLAAVTHLLLGVLAGYDVPTPAGEGGQVASTTFVRPWALPLIVGSGALLGAILVFWIAPEAEGHGTDAAISAVHHNPRGIRFRAIIVKIVASALTIGSGGSGGREGPTAQISAGVGSLLARELELSPADARTAVVTGIGSGIGAIFGAPLGGAVLSTEILYRDDFDATALLPSFVASIVGYVIFAGVVGFRPLFGLGESYQFADPADLLWFALIGLLGGVVGLLYAKGFYGIADVSAAIQLPSWLKPAIGGVAVGCIALVIPEVLGTGYGWVQQSLDHRLLSLPLWIVLILPFARILATGLSIGTGGSGGIFGPGMVIGAFVGASVWRLFEPIAPSMGHNPAPYVIVGMMCCFGGISRAPLAVMLMVAEMTGNLSVLAPAMVAVGLAWFIVRRSDDTIYRSQLKSRADAPAQRLLIGMPILANVSVRQAMARPRLVIAGGSTPMAATHNMERAGVAGAPVVDHEGRFEGTIALEKLVSVRGGDTVVRGLVDTSAPTVAESEHLDVALDALTSSSDHWISVLDGQRKVSGTIGMSDIVRGYRLGLLASLDEVGKDGSGGGFDKIRIASTSPLVGQALRQAHLPVTVIVTTLQRRGDLVVPNGGTTFEAGNELLVIGEPTDIESVREAARACGADGLWVGHANSRTGQASDGRG
jgi:chloride channel protein, CIC family